MHQIPCNRKVVVSLKLLGPVQVTWEEAQHPRFRSNKAIALLGYLAAENRLVSRDALTGLFWADEPEQQARGELRRVLHNLSTIVPDCLTVDRRTVHFQVAADSQLDIAAFHSLQARGDISSLTSAADLYRGGFMEGIFLNDCPEFDTWLLTERERWRRQVEQVMVNLVNHHAGRGAYAESLRFASRLVSLAPWREEAQRQMMLLLARSGQRSAALAQFETCRRVLAEELAVEPTEETIDLYERIKSMKARPAHNLPAQPTPFIGREEEVEAIAQLLAGPDYRLLTITGSGGVGKTRLAIEVARLLVAEKKRVFLDGASFVPMTAATTFEYLFPAIAEAVGFPHGSGRLESSVLEYLHNKEMLLIFDNFETVLSDRPGMATLIADLLAAAPQVRILVTSRQVLNLQGEWVFPLNGLPFPTSAPKDKPPPAPASSYGAVTLFTRCAQRAWHAFDLAVEEAAVIRICQLVEGLPLALELAAGWRKVLTCTEILHEIEQGLDILNTDQSNVPERHRSLRAVFESSWARLSPENQQVLAKLSVFPGGFDRVAASRVTATDFRRLATLVDQSLLRFQGEEGTPDWATYEMHDLIRYFAAEKLAQMPPKVGEKIREEHGRYFADLVQNQTPALRSARRTEALAALGRNIENVRAGWKWAVAGKHWSVLASYVDGLHLFYELRNWFEEGQETFSLAASVPKAEGVLQLKMLARQGWFCYRLNQYDQARQLATTSLVIAQHLEEQWETAFAQKLLGAIAFAQGHYQEARTCYRRSLTIWRELQDRWGTATSLLNLGLVHQALGEYQLAQQPYQEGLALLHESGYQYGATTAVGALGQIARSLGDFNQARELCQRSLVIHREMGDPWGVAAALDGLGAIDLGLGKYDAARESFQISLAVRRELDDRPGMAAALAGLGQSAFLSGEYPEAERHSRHSLAIYRQLGDRRGTARALNNLGYLAILRGEVRQASQSCQKSLELYRKLGHRPGIAAALTILGQAACISGTLFAAKEYLDEAWQMAQDMAALPVALDILLGWAMLQVRQEQFASAGALLALTLNHPANTSFLKEKAKRLVPEVTVLPEKYVRQAKAGGSITDLTAVV
ncbi:MAG: tetratricopeptide repeat protein, partial [Candidatus Promineifilaceae bacterium]